MGGRLGSNDHLRYASTPILNGRNGFTMTVSLTPAEAEAKIQQIHDSRDHAVAKLNQVRDAQQSMLNGSWHGGSAGAYGKTSVQQSDEFDSLIATLNDIVDKASTHMRQVSHADNA
jgi:uncharacterized protein YukE